MKTRGAEFWLDEGFSVDGDFSVDDFFELIFPVDGDFNFPFGEFEDDD